VGAALAGMGLQTLGRLLYFGEWLPNTYYLKLTGYPLLLRLSRGLVDLWNFAWGLNPLLILLPLVVLRPWRSTLMILPGAVLAGQAAYHVWAGGDIFTSRFLLTAMPLFMVLLSLALERIREWCAQSRRRRLRIGFWVALPVILLVFSGIHDGTTARMWLGDPEAFKDSQWVYDNFLHVRRSIEVNRIIAPDARTAVTWAGVQGYFIRGNIIDMLGKADSAVARLPGRVPEGPGRWTAFYPGHMKWDYAYSIGRLRPDLVLEFWGDPEEARPFLEKDYERIRVGGVPTYLRKGSPRILWGNLRP